MPSESKGGVSQSSERSVMTGSRKCPTAVCSRCPPAGFPSGVYAAVRMCTCVHAVEVREHPQPSSGTSTFMA